MRAAPDRGPVKLSGTADVFDARYCALTNALRGFVESAT
jgi:hypothetical protein